MVACSKTAYCEWCRNDVPWELPPRAEERLVTVVARRKVIDGPGEDTYYKLHAWAAENAMRDRIMLITDVVRSAKAGKNSYEAPDRVPHEIRADARVALLDAGWIRKEQYRIPRVGPRRGVWVSPGAQATHGILPDV